VIYLCEVVMYVVVNCFGQIQSLLTDRRVNEALELARGVHKTGLSNDKFTAVSIYLLLVFHHSQFTQYDIETDRQKQTEEHIQSKKLKLYEALNLYWHFLMVTVIFSSFNMHPACSSAVFYLYSYFNFASICQLIV